MPGDGDAPLLAVKLVMLTMRLHCLTVLKMMGQMQCWKFSVKKGDRLMVQNASHSQHSV